MKNTSSKVNKPKGEMSIGDYVDLERSKSNQQAPDTGTSKRSQTDIDQNAPSQAPE